MNCEVTGEISLNASNLLIPPNNNNTSEQKFHTASQNSLRTLIIIIMIKYDYDYLYAGEK